MPFCVAAPWKGHRRSEEEDLGHVRPPDSAGGEREEGGSIVTTFRFLIIVIIFAHESGNSYHML